MSDPIASVVMITYNHREYISQAIECVLRQETDFPFELVIGEDCSTDGTRDIVFDYHRRYPDIVRVVTSERNAGMNANVLRTERACRGKYIAYCEGDDYWHNPHKLRMQVHYLEHNPHYGMVHSDVDVEYVARNQVIRAFQRTIGADYTGEDDQFLRILEGRYRIYTCTVCAKKDLIDTVTNHNPELRDCRFLMGDKPRWLEVSRLVPIGYLPDSLATYRVVPESATNSRNASKRVAFARSSLEMHAHYCSKYSVPDATRKIALRSQYSQLLRLAFVADDMALAREARSGIASVGIRLTPSQALEYYSVRLRALAPLARASLKLYKNVSLNRHIHRWIVKQCCRQ